MANPKSVSEIVQQHAPTINEIITQGKTSLQIQAVGGKLSLYLKGHEGLTIKVRVPPPSVGAHPCNRKTAMLEPMHAHRLLASFVRKGFDFEKVLQALGCEIEPGAVGEHAREENVGAGLLPPCVAEILSILTVINSHTSAALRIVHYSDVPRVKAIPKITDFLAGENGYISKERVYELCPSIREPAEQGIEYTLVRWQVVKACPGVMELLMEADNAQHDNVQMETPIQAMLGLHARFAATPAGEEPRARGDARAREHSLACCFILIYIYIATRQIFRQQCT